MTFWIYFRGTRNGEYVEAASLPAAKRIFAAKHGLKSLSYVAGKKSA